MRRLARVLIVDDLEVMRTGIRSLLDEHCFRVCGEAGDGREAIEKARELNPDIVLMDITMPGMNGVNAALKIRRISPATKIVFLTVHNLPGVADSTRRWADGFVSKAAAGSQLLPLLRSLVETRPPGFKNDLYDSSEEQVST